MVGADHVRVNDGDVAPFAHDATPLFSSRPDAVVFPGSTAEVAAVLRLAGEHRVPLVPRGAGSNLCAGAVALRGGIVHVLTRLDQLLDVSAEELLVLLAMAGDGGDRRRRLSLRRLLRTIRPEDEPGGLERHLNDAQPR